MEQGIARRVARAITRRVRGDARVSVVVPCFNAGPFLTECVDSVRRQGVPETEVIIVDDGSTEPDTREVLSRLARDYEEVEVLRTENRGPGPARNVGLARATGRFIVLLDADDVLGEGFLPVTISALEGRPDCDVGYTDVETFGLRSSLWRTGPLLLQWELYLDNWMSPAFMIRRDAVDRVGGYGAAIPPYADWDFYLRLHEAGARFAKVRGVRVHYRIRADSLLRSTLGYRPVLVTHLVLSHSAAYGRLFGWRIGPREEQQARGLLKLAMERPDEPCRLDALRVTRVYRQFEAWSRAYRGLRRLTRMFPDRLSGGVRR